MAVKITVTEKELDNQLGNGGLEICIPGTAGNPQDKESCPIFIEKYDGNIRVVIWNGTEDPQIIQLIPKGMLCPSCRNDLRGTKAVQRTYINKTREDEDGIALGYYEKNGDFEPQEKIDWDNDCSYDLIEDSDSCTNCGKGL